MPQSPGLAPIYITARRVLLDALEALSPQIASVIVVGAQAVYLRTEEADLAVAPYTADADMAIDPGQLEGEPRIDAMMREAGFTPPSAQPGAWVKTAEIEGRSVEVPVDLMVPDSLAPIGSRRSVRIPPHDKMAMRKAVGLEAAVVDNDVLRISALDETDNREFEVRVAASTALIIAKVHKLAERVEIGNEDRIADKDAADVYRLMQTTPAAVVASRLERLMDDEIAGPTATQALELLQDLFSARGRPGVRMAVHSLRGAVPAERVEEVTTTFVRAVNVRRAP